MAALVGDCIVHVKLHGSDFWLISVEPKGFKSKDFNLRRTVKFNCLRRSTDTAQTWIAYGQRMSACISKDLE